MQGTIARLVPDQGFDFITGADGRSRPLPTAHVAATPAIRPKPCRAERGRGSRRLWVRAELADLEADDAEQHQQQDEPNRHAKKPQKDWHFGVTSFLVPV